MKVEEQSSVGLFFAPPLGAGGLFFAPPLGALSPVVIVVDIQKSRIVALNKRIVCYLFFTYLHRPTSHVHIPHSVSAKLRTQSCCGAVRGQLPRFPCGTLLIQDGGYSCDDYDFTFWYLQDLYQTCVTAISCRTVH